MWGEGQYWFGILPFSGPGNWFISVVFQSIVFLPLLYYLFNKNPRLTVIASFFFEGLFKILW